MKIKKGINLMKKEKKTEILGVFSLDSREEYTKNGKRYERLSFKPNKEKTKEMKKEETREKETKEFMVKVGMPLFIELTKIDNEQNGELEKLVPPDKLLRKKK